MCSVCMTTLKLGLLCAIIVYIKDVYHKRIKGSVMCIVFCSIPKPEGLVDVNRRGSPHFVDELKENTNESIQYEPDKHD